jgi:serine/threonine-protein kinase
MSITTGTRFGSYDVGEVIGAGGMGEVYRATDTKLKRDVAIKVLPAAVASDPDRLARFRREAEVLAALNHPNIAQIYGLEEVDNVTALVMELVEGPTLADRITGGPLRANDAMSIAYQIIDALEAAHERQIVHRDLKPANIKVRSDGTVKVLDFGIAKAIETQSPLSGPQAPSLTTPAMTQAGILLGTAAYMAPEQARGKPVDRRADIWAFGCVLYEMLTGQPAFGGEDVPITLARVLAHDWDKASLPGVVSPAVRHTIALCLEKDPKKRIADIADVRLALRGRLEVVVGSGSEGPKAAPLWRRVLPVAAGVLLASLVTFLVSTGLLEPAPAEVRRSVHRLPAEQAPNVPNVPVLAVSPDGSEIAYAVGGALYRRRLSELDGRPIPGTEGENAIVPVYSPDGRWLLFGSTSDSQVKRISVDGGTPLPVLPFSPQLGWTWRSEDVIFFATNCEISRVTPDGGTPELVTGHANAGCPEPALLPGGEYLLYERRPAGASERAEIVVESLGTGETTVLFPGRQPFYLDDGYLVYYDMTLGLMARAFDARTLEHGSPAAFVSNIYFPVTTGGVHFRVSPNGTLAYISGEATGGGGAMVGIADASGDIAALGLPMRNYQFPSVSPDGARVALQIGSGESTDIFIYELAGDSEIRQLTLGGGNRHPVWSPDGIWITYSSDRDGRSRIYRQRADGGGVAEALTDPAENRGHQTPAWAPDGRLTYAEIGIGPPDIFIVEIPDGEPELLVGGEGQQLGISFSPDGSAMAYHSNSTGTPEVLAEPFPPDGSRTRISEAGVISVWPVWSRSGSRLTYQTGTGGFVAVDVVTPGFALRNRRTLPGGGDPNQRRLDSMPDDERVFVTIQSAGLTTDRGGSTEIVIVENWLEEIRARVPAP